MPRDARTTLHSIILNYTMVEERYIFFFLSSAQKGTCAVLTRELTSARAINHEYSPVERAMAWGRRACGS